MGQSSGKGGWVEGGGGGSETLVRERREETRAVYLLDLPGKPSTHTNPNIFVFANEKNFYL